MQRKKLRKCEAANLKLRLDALGYESLYSNVGATKKNENLLISVHKSLISNFGWNILLLSIPLALNSTGMSPLYSLSVQYSSLFLR